MAQDLKQYQQEYHRKWYAEHRQEQKEYARRKRKQNYSKLHERQHKYYLAHRERLIAYSKWYSYHKKPDMDPVIAEQLHNEYLQQKAMNQ